MWNMSKLIGWKYFKFCCVNVTSVIPNAFLSYKSVFFVYEIWFYSWMSVIIFINFLIKLISTQMICKKITLWKSNSKKWRQQYVKKKFQFLDLINFEANRKNNSKNPIAIPTWSKKIKVLSLILKYNCNINWQLKTNKL